MSELTVAVQIKQNSPSSRVTAFEVAVNETPPLVPLHSYVGLTPSAAQVNTSPALYGEPLDVMVTGGGHSAYKRFYKVVFLLQITVTMTLAYH